MSPDLINGLIELLAAGFILNHCRVLVRDQEVRGISKLSMVFFTLWGAWNMIFYPLLGQWWSFAGGIAVVAANALWLTLVMKYRLRALQA